MKGSEKQIAWATEIRSNIIKTFEAAKAEVDTTTAAQIDNMVDRLNNAAYAASIINIFRAVRITGNTYEDVANIMACYHIHRPNTPDEHNILGK